VQATTALPRTFARWEDLLAVPLDAVLILTSGSHAPIAIAAAEAGKHMLIEKPMCFSVAEGREMIDSVRRAGVTLMVGYNKRYDPAYRRLCEEIGGLSVFRLLRVTTLESPLQPYIAHYRLHKAAGLAPELAAAFQADNQARITAAIGEAEPLARHAYHLVLLDSMVHEFNAIRGVLGEPDRLDFADIRETGLTAVLRRDGMYNRLGRSAGNRPLRDGTRLLRARPPPHPFLSLPVSAQHADAAPG
jgi:predicted dehydrogenase